LGIGVTNSTGELVGFGISTSIPASMSTPATLTPSSTLTPCNTSPVILSNILPLISNSSITGISLFNLFFKAIISSLAL